MSIVVLSFVVWVHHFFTMGAGANVNAFFGIMTMVIAIPTGVKVFNWLFTMFRGRILFATPMLWFMGFITTFILGGMTGVLMSVPAADFQLHNSLFLVAHFHNMIIGGVLFGFFAGLTYWFPKMFGFKLNERLGKYAFWCWITGFLLAFVPLYILGFMGATRRLNQIEPEWQSLFIVAGIGACIIGLALFFQLLQIVVSVIQRKKNIAGNDPWNGRTLEWATSSPPPLYNFAKIPWAAGRDAWWMIKHRELEISHNVVEAEGHVGRGASRGGDMSAGPIHLPKNSPLALVIAVLAGVLGFALIWHIWWVVPLALLLILGTCIYRAFEEDTEYKITV